MELRVKQPSFPEIIEFNFSELKEEITRKTSEYINLVYTEDQIKDAKKDVATLRKFTKAISDERIRIKKECLKPYEDFEAKIKELDGIVGKAIQNIDSQVKAFEDQKKNEKLEEIKAFFENTVHADWLTLEKIFDEKWLNASVRMSAVESEILSKLEQIETDIMTLQNLPDFSFEAVEVYKDTLDINRAIQEGKRLSEIQSRKAEAEAVQPEPKKAEEEIETISKNVGKFWISFKAYMTPSEAKELRQFFEDKHIEFEAL